MTDPQTQRPTEELLRLYRQMLLIRRCEEQLAKSHQRGLVHGACHTYVGQEAIAVGVCSHLRREDVVFSTHRGHGHALAKGVPPVQLIAELYGRATGCSQGRGGSMHLFSPEVGMMGTSGIVGPCILQATGAGYSFRLLKQDHVAVAFFGDGAVNNAAFHEGLNLAAIWKLPVLFVCENNQFATEVPFAYAAGNPSVAARGATYGMPGIELDGNDVVAIRAAAGEAVARARSGGGPTLFECKTYRTRPHAEGMGDYTYRTREDVENWKTKCPIDRLRKAFSANLAPLDAIDAEVQREIEAAQREAEASAWPDPATATTHIYAEARRPAPPPPADSGRDISYSQATLEALGAEMAANPAIFVLGEGIGVRGGNFKTTAGLYDKFGPERLRDTPICERGFVGLGGGAAMTGTRPVIDFMFADFVLDGVGEIVNQIAKMQYMSSGRLKMPILLRGCIGIGHSAATHHSGNYYPMYAHFPGLHVVIPSTPYDAKGLLHHALRCDDPVMFLEPREILSLTGPVPEAPYEIPFGQAAVVNTGTDVTVVAIGRMVRKVFDVIADLGREGISVELIDPRTVAPLDTETIGASVAKTGRLLIVDEAFGLYGIGAEIAAQIADRFFDELDAPIKRLNGLHTPTPYSPPLEAAVVPNADAIARAIRDLLAE
ncbi:Acetoin:2,6-dichlorophenolindophenol oxidoreductase subunit alpha [Gemmata sp. SH-PL17]|uniref:alpha-ketoacid dehydrogenase subunit alpha/beta n=1 Tax=Gemmata sp. SH-PL17 TaxID=1630693 RepID=UPI00078DE6DE|nr:pyruvate dehydrogenase complex E1 component subunit beta [Gemmata sp. SH-PL17]AMV23386.1 Acetoin:2,6-dichlorophenolindophenol oxidoreductase subunit alpha [Gemmata sp. SH-PL17]